MVGFSPRCRLPPLQPSLQSLNSSCPSSYHQQWLTPSRMLIRNSANNCHALCQLGLHKCGSALLVCSRSLRCQFAQNVLSTDISVVRSRSKATSANTRQSFNRQFINRAGKQEVVFCVVDCGRKSQGQACEPCATARVAAAGHLCCSPGAWRWGQQFLLEQ